MIEYEIMVAARLVWEKLSVDEIRQLLGLKPFWEYEKEALENRPWEVRMSQEYRDKECVRQTGRTTREIVNAIYAICQGQRRIYIYAATDAMTRYIKGCLLSYLLMLDFPERESVHFYRRTAQGANSIVAFRDGYVLVDHTANYYNKGVA